MAPGAPRIGRCRFRRRAARQNRSALLGKVVALTCQFRSVACVRAVFLFGLCGFGLTSGSTLGMALAQSPAAPSVPAPAIPALPSPGATPSQQNLPQNGMQTQQQQQSGQQQNLQQQEQDANRNPTDRTTADRRTNNDERQETQTPAPPSRANSSAWWPNRPE